MNAIRAHRFMQELETACRDQSRAAAAAVIIKAPSEREQIRTAKAELIADVKALREYIKELELHLLTQKNGIL